METNIGACGIDCSKCDAYLATKNNDDKLREKTAENWSKMYNANLTAKDINCLGCRSDVLFGHCHDCDIRRCNTDRSLHNCSGCSDYSCDKITEFHKMVPEAKTLLDSLR